MMFKTKPKYISPTVRGAVSLLPDSALLAASVPRPDPDPISNSYVIEGQEVDSYWESSDLNNTWN